MIVLNVDLVGIVAIIEFLLFVILLLFFLINSFIKDFVAIHKILGFRTRETSFL